MRKVGTVLPGSYSPVLIKKKNLNEAISVVTTPMSLVKQ